MGIDGRDGARAVRAHGGNVFAQDEASSTIFGMPAAVIDAGLADRVLPLQRMAAAIAEWCARGLTIPAGADSRTTSMAAPAERRLGAR
jgi:two-component system chemotaxis response regulator CheB